MKTDTEKRTKSGLLNRPEPMSQMSLPHIDFALRRANRALPTERLLVLMKVEAKPGVQRRGYPTASRNCQMKVEALDGSHLEPIWQSMDQ